MSNETPPTVDLITLTRYVSSCSLNQSTPQPEPSHVLHDQLRLGDAATGDLTLLLTAIQVTSKFIATNVRKARLINLYVSDLIAEPTTTTYLSRSDHPLESALQER